MDDDFDFICNYLNEHSHEKNLIDRIKSEICEKEKELEKLDGLIKKADEKVEKIGQFSTDESPLDASIESKTTLIRNESDLSYITSLYNYIDITIDITILRNSKSTLTQSSIHNV